MPTTITSGDRTKLPGPRTRVRDEEKGVELYTEYHQADAGAPAYVLGKTPDGKADLIATGVRDQVELAAAIEAAKTWQPKPGEEVIRGR